MTPDQQLAATPSNGSPTATHKEHRGSRAGGGAQAPVSAAPLPSPRPSHVEEAAVEVKADPKMSALGKSLAEKASKLGRPLGVMLMDTDDRSRLLKAGQAVKGQATRVEGEGHNRRVVFFPDKPVPMPKKSQFPVFDDEEDADE
jgi:hypothetical protein